MVKEGGEGNYGVPVLRCNNLGGVLCSGSYDPAVAWRVPWPNELLANVSIMQPRKRGFNGRRVLFPTYILEYWRNAMVRKEVSTRTLEDRRSDV